MQISSPDKLPIVKTIDSIAVPIVKQVQLSNGVPVFILSGGKSAAIKVDFVFKAGSWYAKKALVAHFCNEMLLEGTDKISASKLMERLDFYGAYVQPSADKDFAGISLFGMSDKLKQMLQLIDPMIKRSIFPDKNLETLLSRHKQQFIIDQAKPKVVANKTSMAMLFGPDHPYGWNSQAIDFEHISRYDLIDHHQKFYGNSRLSIIISGRVNAKELDILDVNFGSSSWLDQSNPNPSYRNIKSNEREKQIVLDNTVQASIRISRQIVPRTHPDYIGLQILNTILGGYFGSRLMKNLREDKAITYGISSGIQNLVHASLLSITTEVGKEFVQQALDEIWHEIDILQHESVPLTELERVKNYFLGNLLHNFEGPINSSDAFRSLWEGGLDFSFVASLVEEIKKIRPADILTLAARYLNRTDFIEVVAG